MVGPWTGLVKGSYSANFYNIICELISANDAAETATKAENQSVACGRPVLNSSACYEQFVDMIHMP